MRRILLSATRILRRAPVAAAVCATTAGVATVTCSTSDPVRHASTALARAPTRTHDAPLASAVNDARAASIAAVSDRQTFTGDIRTDMEEFTLRLQDEICEVRSLALQSVLPIRSQGIEHTEVTCVLHVCRQFRGSTVKNFTGTHGHAKRGEAGAHACCRMAECSKRQALVSQLYLVSCRVLLLFRCLSVAATCLLARARFRFLRLVSRL